MKDNDWKKRLGMVYSTNPAYSFAPVDEPEAATLPKSRQRLRVRIERAGRGGKTVTLVTGFCGGEQDLKALAKTLKTKLGTGGNAKDGEIVIQGDVREKTVALLRAEGYADAR